MSKTLSEEDKAKLRAEETELEEAAKSKAATRRAPQPKYSKETYEEASKDIIEDAVVNAPRLKRESLAKSETSPLKGTTTTFTSAHAREIRDFAAEEQKGAINDLKDGTPAPKRGMSAEDAIERYKTRNTRTKQETDKKVDPTIRMAQGIIAVGNEFDAENVLRKAMVARSSATTSEGLKKAEDATTRAVKAVEQEYGKDAAEDIIYGAEKPKDERTQQRDSPSLTAAAITKIVDVIKSGDLENLKDSIADLDKLTGDATKPINSLITQAAIYSKNPDTICTLVNILNTQGRKEQAQQLAQNGLENCIMGIVDVIKSGNLENLKDSIADLDKLTGDATKPISSLITQAAVYSKNPDTICTLVNILNTQGRKEQAQQLAQNGLENCIMGRAKESLTPEKTQENIKSDAKKILNTISDPTTLEMAADRLAQKCTKIIEGKEGIFSKILNAVGDFCSERFGNEQEKSAAKIANTMANKMI